MFDKFVVDGYSDFGFLTVVCWKNMTTQMLKDEEFMGLFNLFVVCVLRRGMSSTMFV